MKLLEVFDKPSVPDRYRFVFDEVNQLGLYAVLAMTENGSAAAWVRERYDPNAENDHLGQRVLVGALGARAIDGFMAWAAINTEYGRDENGQIIREDE